MLKSYRKEIEVLMLTIDVPYYEDVETRISFYTYEDVLLRLFNNKRENEDILEIRNYYGNNKITICVNLTSYLSECYSEREEAIDYLKTWLTNGLDVSNDMVEQKIRKGYIYSIPDYENNIRDLVNDELIENYVELER